MNIFASISELPPDPIFGLAAEYKRDPRPGKYTFITGYFLDEALKVPLLDTVSEIEAHLVQSKQNHEYLPIDGDQEFLKELQTLIFGEVSDRSCAIQTVGGTGALYLIGRLATLFTDQIAIPNPTWANHWGIFSLAGLKTVGYTYYREKQLPYAELIKDLNSLPKNSCVLLHASCHNPTGLDFSKQQWIELSALIKKRELFPVLDMAYHGFAKTPDEDAYPARLFSEKGLEFALTYTCAKNFSLYGERAGALYVFTKTSEKISAIRSHLKHLVRGSYSNPPMHASNIVKGILKDPSLKKAWLRELESMRKRMDERRTEFIDHLVAKDPKGNWEPHREGKGLFFYSEKSPQAVAALRKEKGFYLAADGRINLTGFNDQNLEPFIDAFLEV